MKINAFQPYELFIYKRTSTCYGCGYHGDLKNKIYQIPNYEYVTGVSVVAGFDDNGKVTINDKVCYYSLGGDYGNKREIDLSSEDISVSTTTYNTYGDIYGLLTLIITFYYD